MSEEQTSKGGWLSRLRAGLKKTSSRIGDGLVGIFTKRKLDAETLEELEELLIQADLGPATAAKVTAGLAKGRYGQDLGLDEIKALLADEIAKILEPVAQPLNFAPAGSGPRVVVMVGVNGTGKTTTLGKLSSAAVAQRRRVLLAAGDTFRAAAVEQLEVWGQRAGVPVLKRETGADAAGLAFDAVERGRRDGMDLVFIDTAGRLHNKAGLMAELQKIVRVIGKVDPEAPHEIVLALDATTGQNAINQVETFKSMVPLTGLVLTKLDGTAKGGVLVALADRFGLPVHAVGVGEGIDDLKPFEARAFARALVGLET
ncbi:signal recognition particle-docking protein FtsY [uncultured Tistrella sp.]|uniref:signal recognition particle-docking protein FtsY n=1 Tax=Tistrella mobilis TaxID=171437 RepID=UPI000C0AA6EE|nr:signal recognition particle-docking protein FtsY [uncultured Tistrella sp.]MAM74420.1 signal recognition particle-docking protein FtsY [Tistrella sp.]